MRVLHLVWNLIRGGTEGQCARAVLALPAQGVTSRVGVSRREGLFVAPVEALCGPLYEMHIQRVASLRTVTEVLRLARYIRAERIDLVHAWDADAEIFGSLAAQRAGCPLLTSRRDLGEIYAPWKLRLMQRADRRARAVVVNADAIAARVRASGVPAERVVVLPNILDVDEFDRLAARPAPAADRLGPGRWIAHVARLDPEKDAATFVRAAVRVAQAVPDARFVLAGDGTQRGELEKLAAEEGAAGRIVFLGDVTDVPALLTRATACVLCPNSNEGLSNAILEYMAARRPVVATDCGGNRELVESCRTGFVVPAGDYEALAERLIILLRDPERAALMGDAGRRRVESHHRPEVVARQLADLYRTALAR